MNKELRVYMALALLLNCAAVALADDIPCEIPGMLGLTPVTENSCAAIWLPVPEGNAIAGVRWYNNDDLTVFPQVLVASGAADELLDRTEAHVAAENVQGPAEGWGQVMFDQPYACQSEGLYVVFMMPEGSEYEGLGTGGGAAFGYTDGECGHLAWLGGDDNSWIRIAGAIGLAIDPVLVDANGDMVLLKSMGPGGGVVQAVPTLVGARPNPFNPQTVLEYSVPQAMNVELRIYDVRGQLVRDLVSGFQEAGSHTVSWQGKDDSGRQMSSGVYLARFVAGNVAQSQRLLLVK